MSNLKLSDMTIENQSMTRAKSYGMYYVEGTVNGVDVKTISNNSQAFDWFGDDADMDLHESAKSYVDYLLIDTYESL
jgi:hypothetical protein